MTDNERALLLAEKSRIEAVISEIRQTKDAKELEVIRGGHSPQQEFNLRRKIQLESRQASAAVRGRLSEIFARLQELKSQSPEQSQAELLKEILATLREVRDDIQKWRSESCTNGLTLQQS
jgi:uncharacterized protein involved in exopolysaccharide biosynthesis